MLHQRDNQMLLLNPNAPDKIYCMDLEREKIIEEWVRNEVLTHIRVDCDDESDCRV